ncbi:MAG: hypothetical protein M1815_006274 [Lichina confinis]|nr:MAG: hypothetical protein M1815_006274 [Lichina confinis]
MTIAESVHRFLLAGAEESFEGSSQLQVVGRVGISVVELRCTSPGACKLISNSTGILLGTTQRSGERSWKKQRRSNLLTAAHQISLGWDTPTCGRLVAPTLGQWAIRVRE